METLETLARRMDTAESLRDLVRTMKSLAAVSIRQYERSLAALAEYDRTVELGLQAALRGEPPPLPQRPGAGGRSGIVIVGSDQGLCGSFNEQLVERAVADVGSDLLVPARYRVLAVGARMAERSAEAGVPVEVAVSGAASATMVPSLVQDLLLVIDGWRDEGDLEEVVLYHHRPHASSGSRPHRQPLLPIAPEQLRALQSQPWPTRMVPRRTVPRSVLLGALARQSLTVTLHRALAWSSASEHANRLMAMQAAERSIDDRLEQLRGAYHLRRQTDITTEVLDIISGAEALTG